MIEPLMTVKATALFRSAPAPLLRKRTTPILSGWPKATARARSYFSGYRPSSPAIALLRNGAVVSMLERSDIENRDAPAIAAKLTAAFGQFCASTTTASQSP